MFKTLNADRSTIENKFHKTDEEYNALDRFVYRGYDFDPTTGLSDEEMDEGLADLVQKMKGQPHPLVKAKAVEYVLDHTRIDVNEKDYFVGLYSHGRMVSKHTIYPWRYEVWNKAMAEIGNRKVQEFDRTGTAWNWLDFDHTVPDWESMTRLGFSGILQRAHDCYNELKEAGELTEKKEIFYQAIVIEYEALLRFIDRLYQYACTKEFEKAPVIAECLKNLRDGAPQTTYDVLQMIWIYFLVSEHVDHYQVRALGYGLDSTLYPYFLRDMEQKNFSKEEIAEFIGYFLMQFAAIDNYWGHPMYLAGTNVDGSTKVNELSHMILDIYDNLGIYNPKIQIKFNKNTPKDFVQKALNMIRSGISSIVFVNEDIIVKSLMRRGATYEEAVDSVVRGCYEYKVKNDGIDISSIYMNALKPVSLVLHNGIDLQTGLQIGVPTGEVEKFTTFKEFYHAYLTQFDYIVETSIECLSKAEQYVHEVNPTALFSATMEKCVTTMTDAMDGGLTNETGTLLNGFASAVDALMAVDELVYEKQVVTLQQLKEALDQNWEGYEKLRLQALNCKHKYGVGDRKADSYANTLHQHYAGLLANRRNCHGGHYVYELHSARSFVDQGARTEATPDGRKFGEETSKNGSPSIGADRNGITALISSVTNMDLSLSDSGACLDAMLHPSAVQGEGGLDVLYNVLQTYMVKGGASIHFNIFNVDTLRDAQKHPEKYRSLQVRVCGWNILWNNMAKEEQEAYIKRAENIV